MFYKVLPGSNTYDELTALVKKITAVNNAARELAIELGAKQWTMRNSPFVLYGGIGMLKFDEKPKGWKNAGSKGSGGYLPSDNLKGNESLLKRIKDLPVVESKELNSIVNYNEQDFHKEGRNIWSTHCGFRIIENGFLINIDEYAAYEPAEGIVEITYSEYKQLAEPPF